MIQAADTKSCIWGRRLCEAHDRVTRTGFALAAAFLAAIVCSYCFEVVSRYFFSAPTTWVGSLVSYLLCGSIFLVLPELTRQKSHIFISLVPDMLTPRNATRLIRFGLDRKSTRLNSSHVKMSYAVFCLKKNIR